MVSALDLWSEDLKVSGSARLVTASCRVALFPQEAFTLVPKRGARQTPAGRENLFPPWTPVCMWISGGVRVGAVEPKALARARCLHTISVSARAHLH